MNLSHITFALGARKGVFISWIPELDATDEK
jgi:hypothetical protein